MDVPDNLQKAKALMKVMPLLEVTAMICFYQDQFGEVGELIMDMVRTEGAFLDLASYVHGYFEWYEGNSTADLRDFRLIDEAYAAVPIRGPVKNFLDTLNSLKHIADEKQIKEIGKKIGRVIKMLETAKIKNIEEITAEMYKDVTLKAFLYAGEIGSKTAGELRTEAMSNLRKFIGSANISHLKLFEMISELPIDEFNLDTLEGLQKVFKEFSINFNRAHGAAHQIKLIHHYIKSNKGVIQAVEASKAISNAYKEIGKRTYDAIIKIGNTEYLYDSKAWSPNYIKERIFKSIKGEPIDGEAPGQLFKDIIHMYQNPDVKVRWAFDSRSAGDKEK